MAELYRRFAGATGKDHLAWVIARHVDVQAALASEAVTRAEIAEAKLAAHVDTGASSIRIESADVDYHVILEDDSDKPNAMAIEMGAAGGRGGVHALGTAFPEIRAARGA